MDFSLQGLRGSGSILINTANAHQDEDKSHLSVLDQLAGGLSALQRCEWALLLLKRRLL